MFVRMGNTTKLLKVAAIGLACCTVALSATDGGDWKSRIPHPVFPERGLVDLYYEAWTIAHSRVTKGPEGLPSSPYMDEAHSAPIFIWDTCFMSLFCKYAPQDFPGMSSLDNFYVPIIDGKEIPLKVEWLDNPPLFAWIERDYFRFSNDRERLNRILNEKQYLQKFFDWFNTTPKGYALPHGKSFPVQKRLVTDVGHIGHAWTGLTSGMDNTPRGRGLGRSSKGERIAADDYMVTRDFREAILKKIEHEKSGSREDKEYWTAKHRELDRLKHEVLRDGYDKILWVDAISQQALVAMCIRDLFEAQGNSEQAAVWSQKYEDLKKTINDVYWDEEDGCYYDVEIATMKPCRVKTPASFWPLLAKVASPEQAERMARLAEDPEVFGGKYPWVSMLRSDPEFHPQGNYWEGSVWLPMVYMGTKALENYGYVELADKNAENTVRQQLRTWKNFSPHSIWECYHPDADEPAGDFKHRYRANFCGWSALGPISLFIENIMGFRHVDAINREVLWSLKKINGKHGLKNLRFGNIVTDIVFDGNDKILVSSNDNFTLIVNGHRYPVTPETKEIVLN